MAKVLNALALETRFTATRTHNGWQDCPVTDEQIPLLACNDHAHGLFYFHRSYHHLIRQEA